MWSRRLGVEFILARFGDSGPCVVAWNIRYVVVGGCFLCFVEWCYSCEGCLCLMVWGVYVAGVAMREVVDWSAAAGLVVKSGVGAVSSVRGSDGVHVWSSRLRLGVEFQCVNVTTVPLISCI